MKLNGYQIVSEAQSKNKKKIGFWKSYIGGMKKHYKTHNLDGSKKVRSDAQFKKDITDKYTKDLMKRYPNG